MILFDNNYSGIYCLQKGDVLLYGRLQIYSELKAHSWKGVEWVSISILDSRESGKIKKNERMSGRHKF